MKFRIFEVDMNVRTRFAPSPTGFLHIGGARTALFSWLYAKKMGGKFLLRVEDTDQERSTQEAIKAIFEGMSWLGLESDEEVIYQMQRLDRYQAVADQLLSEGKAYRCHCSKERLEKLREQQMQQKLKPRYDGHCRDKNLPASEHPCVIRFKTPQQGTVTVHDKVYGDVIFHNEELDDVVMLRTDGVPTYNFAVVVDDLDTGITHVIRGDDHLNNTPRQINMLLALNAPVPVYAHVPMILDEDGKKLSKRTGAVSVLHYRDMGIFPEALRNYLARLGWSHGDQEIFTADELVQYFDIKDINKSASALNSEKLLWLNQQYLKTLPIERIKAELQWHLQTQGIDLSAGPAIEDIIELQRDRAKTLKELVEKSLFFYQEIAEYDETASKKFLTLESKPVLDHILSVLTKLPSWDKETLHEVIQQAMQDLNIKMPNLAQPLRVALTGNTLSPSIDLTLLYIGQSRAVARIQAAINICKN